VVKKKTDHIQRQYEDARGNAFKKSNINQDNFIHAYWETGEKTLISLLDSQKLFMSVAVISKSVPRNSSLAFFKRSPKVRERFHENRNVK
jgi:hypothetical protein